LLYHTEIVLPIAIMTPTFNRTARTLFLSGILIVLFAHGSFAHTYLSSVYLNNMALSEGDCVRPHPASGKENPIPLVTAPDMTCGWLPATAANRKCPIAAGSTIGIQWHHNSNAATDDILDPTHKGSIQCFLAKSETGSGNVWFKIFEDGYTGGQWGTDRMIASGGRTHATIPSDIAPGNYLFRCEVLALHNAYAVNGVQPYVGCVELAISGSGSANPTGVAFPGYYTPTGPGMVFDIYNPFSSYPIPGPALYVSGTSPTKPTNPTTAPSAPTTAPSAPTTPTTPTSTPTSAPPAAPTSAPTAGTVKLHLSEGSSVWWLGVIVNGGSEVVVKVEITDSDSVESWTTLVDMSYAFVISSSTQFALPISVRVTSSSGKKVTATNVVTSFSTAVIDTGKTFSTSAPTTRPARPTYAPTAATATYAPLSSSNTMLTTLSGVDVWWFAVSVSGSAAQIAKVELKDSATMSSYATMTANAWGYAYSTKGTPLVTPLTVRVTSASGNVVTAVVATIAPEVVVATNGLL
jgi:cellulase